MCKRDNQPEVAVDHKEHSLVLCADLEGWNLGVVWEGGSRERGSIQFSHSVVSDSL